MSLKCYCTVKANYQVHCYKIFTHAVQVTSPQPARAVAEDCSLVELIGGDIVGAQKRKFIMYFIITKE